VGKEATDVKEEKLLTVGIHMVKISNSSKVKKDNTAAGKLF